MGDTKPTAEHLARANACRSLLTRDSFGLVADDDVQALAAEFAASDAIARRRALDECLHVVESQWGHPVGPYEIAQDIRALLRAPTSEQPRPAPLSPEEQDKRKPLPVEALACAEQDRVHKETGRLVAHTPIAPTSEKAEAKDQESAAVAEEPARSPAANRSPNAGPDTRHSVTAGETARLRAIACAAKAYVEDDDEDRVDSYDAMVAALSRLACSPPADGGGG